LALLDRARALDPRSANIAQSRLFTLVRLGRHADAVRAGDEVRALTPGDMQSIQYQAMAYLALGDVANARRVIREALAIVPPPAMVAQLAGFFEMSWFLEPAEQQLLFRLSPAAFDHDRAWWGQSLATAHWDAGDRSRSRAYADSALAPTIQQMKDSPDGGQTNALYGLMLAYLGRREEALQAGLRGLSAATARGDIAEVGYTHIIVTRIYLVFGMLDEAVETLQKIEERPQHYSAAWMRLDPMFRPLKGHPGFEAMLRRMDS
ncbi:MAG TPA: hypothetical protein VF037_08575, partial [Gemmatimonadales bacterium]